MTTKSISVFFPCYNDAPTIGDLVRNADKILRKVARDYEIIVVNDGSKDNSLEIMKSTKKEVPKLKIVKSWSCRKCASKDISTKTRRGKREMHRLPLQMELRQLDMRRRILPF